MSQSLITAKDKAEQAIEKLTLSNLLSVVIVDENHELYEDAESVLIVYGEKLDNDSLDAITISSGLGRFELDDEFHIGNCSLRSDDAYFYDLESAISAAISQAVYKKVLSNFKNEAVQNNNFKI